MKNLLLFLLLSVNCYAQNLAVDSIRHDTNIQWKDTTWYGDKLRVYLSSTTPSYWQTASTISLKMYIGTTYINSMYGNALYDSGFVWKVPINAAVNMGYYGVTIKDQFGKVYCYSDGFVVNSVPTGIEEIESRKMVRSIKYYSISGQEIPNHQGLMIRITTFSDGSIRREKVLNY